MGLLDIFKKKPKKPKIPKGSKEAEKLFNQGKVIIFTDKRDYVDIDEFIKKASEVPELKEQIEKTRFDTYESKR